MDGSNATAKKWRHKAERQTAKGGRAQDTRPDKNTEVEAKKIV